MKQFCSASIMCADWLNLEEEVSRLCSSDCDYIHCDVMDGHFVPNIMIPTVLVNAISSVSTVPLDIHIMADDPHYIISDLTVRPGDIISVHYECSRHVEKLISAIRSKGAEAFLAINPATPVEMLTELLPELSGILLMTVNPGFAGQKMVEIAPRKIQRARELLCRYGFIDMPIEVDGNCSFENIAKYKDAGANMYVLGTSAIYRKDLNVPDGLKKVREILGDDRT